MASKMEDFNVSVLPKTGPLAYWVECWSMARKTGFNPMSSYDKDSKMVIDATLFNTQQYKVPIKGKVKQSKEWCSALSYAWV